MTRQPGAADRRRRRRGVDLRAGAGARPRRPGRGDPAGRPRARPGRGAAAGGVRGPGPAAGAHRPAARVAGPGRALRRGRPPAAPGARARVPPRHRPRQRLPRGGGRLRRPGAAHRPLLRQDLVAGLPRRRPAARVGRYAAGVRQGLAAADALAAPTAAVPCRLRRRYGTRCRRRASCRTGSTCRPRPPARAGPWSWPPGGCGTRRRGSRAWPPSPLGCPGRSRSRGEAAAGQAGEGVCTTSAGWRRRTCTPAWRRRRSSRPPPATSPSASASWRPRTQGCALVLGELPSLVELWKGAARFVPPGEPEALLAALQELIADTSARERLADAARERAALYTRARMTEGYLGLYGDLLAARRVRPRGVAA